VLYRILFACSFFVSCFVVFAEELPVPSAELLSQIERLSSRKIPLVDYHIHIRGGMTVAKAYDWERKTGIRSGVLENTGKDWPLSDDLKLATFIKDARQFPVLVGIQVNDRDWYKVTDKKLLDELDYVLADTMVMNDETGKPQKLWLEEQYEIADHKLWLERYMTHCMTVVNEPITILANPTYLPPRMEKYYDEFWNVERMSRLIDAGIKNGVAFEIQTTSKFPKRAFIDLARKKGAKFTIGRNNFDDHKEELKRSLDMLEELNIKADEMFVLRKK
jgi:histidinol phosphatase-like PHP family hydrolase